MVNAYLPPVILIPSALEITAITRASPMVITVQVQTPTTESNTYISGMAVRLFVPISYGMFQANNLVGTIRSISGTQFTLNLDSSQFDPFVVPVATSAERPATISPAGSRNYEYTNSSSAVPFQSLNNIGN
jgi:hypothetical protein